MGRVPRRLGAGLILVTLVLAVQTVAASPAVAASLRVTPESGLPGSTVSVSGSGFAPLVEVSLCWDDSGCSDLGTANASLVGTITQDVVIPLSAAEGSHAIHACQLDPLVCASARFRVEAPASTSTSTSTSTTTTTSPTTTTSSASSTTTLPATTTTAAEMTTSTPRSRSERTLPGSGTGPSPTPPAEAPERFAISASPREQEAAPGVPPSTHGTAEAPRSVASRRYLPPTRPSGGAIDEVVEAASVPSTGGSQGTESPESGLAADGVRFWLSWFLLVVALAGASLAAGAALSRRRATPG